MPKPYSPNDKWSQKAAAEGYRARSVYKLQELDDKFRLIKRGMTVLDLGACPGSWLQYASERIGPDGTAIGLDLTPIDSIADNVHTYEKDITDFGGIASILKQHRVERVDVVLSDLAPKTSGIRDVDQWRSIELSQAVIETAKEFLRPKGYCVMKVLRGADFDEFLTELKQDWSFVKTATVKASRDRSKEVYVIVRGPTSRS